MKLAVPRGFRDIPPEVMIPRIKLLRCIEETFRLYGFSPLETPCIEYWETLAGKYGEEAENKLVWKFKDELSGKLYALRYDLTVPLARYVAMHPEIPLPFKRYQIGYVWRHEEPQRGRYREFLQADVDIVGSPYPEADAEVVNVVSKAIERVGLEDYIVRINHRVIMRSLLEKKLSLKQEDVVKIYRAIDKIDKIGLNGVKNELLRIGLSENLANKILDIASRRYKVKEAVDELNKLIGSENPLANKALEELDFISQLLEKPGRVILDLSLVRGLDYYTGLVFEIVLEKGGPGSVAGGGRYDDLIGIFRRAGSLPATGGSIGVERVLDVLVERGILKTEVSSVADVLVVALGEDYRIHAWRVANKLRDNGVRVDIDLMRRSSQKQRKRAQALGIRYILFVGKEEIEKGLYTLYDRTSGSRFRVDFKKLIKIIRGESS